LVLEDFGVYLYISFLLKETRSTKWCLKVFWLYRCFDGCLVCLSEEVFSRCFASSMRRGKREKASSFWREDMYESQHVLAVCVTRRNSES
jgi:hypothetical protein